VSAIDSYGRTIWIADAHRGDGKRFVVGADEKLMAFLKLESALLAATPRSYPGAVNLTGDFWGASRIEIDEKYSFAWVSSRLRMLANCVIGNQS
jgi:hypothetical protein